MLPPPLPIANRQFAAIKAISDGAEEEMDFLAGFIKPEGFQTARFMAHIALRPGLWGRVAALNRNSKLASAALQSAVEECITGLAESLRRNIRRSSAQQLDEKRDMDSDSRFPALGLASHSIPKRMQAAVYYGSNDMRLETVPVPGHRGRRTTGANPYLRDLRDRPEENCDRLALGAAHFRA